MCKGVVVRSRIASVACSVLVLAAAASAAGQGTTLQYRWTPGQEDHYRTTLKTVATMSGMPGGGTQTVEQTMSQTTAMKVLSVAADGTATDQLTFEAVRMEMTTPMGTMVFDSAVKEQPRDPMTAGLATLLTGMVGEAITVVLKPNGGVVKVEGMNRIFEKMSGALAADATTGPLVASLKSSMSDEAMQRTFGQSFSGFPDAPVAPGATWTNTSENVQPIIGTMNTVQTLTLQAVETTGGSAMARIGVVVALKQSAEAPATAEMPMKITMGEAKGTGEITFDVTNGHAQRTTVDMDMPMTMAMTTPDGEFMSIQNSVHTTMVMELLRR
jgi:hypothetical protein